MTIDKDGFEDYEDACTYNSHEEFEKAMMSWIKEG